MLYENHTYTAMLDRTGWVDVRDIAAAHVLALQKEEAAHQRIIVVAGHYVWQDWGECLKMAEITTGS